MEERELAFAGIVRQAELVRAREVSPRELVQTYLDRIERLNPALNAFRTVFADEALAAADEAERRLGQDEDLPLLGVPIAIKDDQDVAGHVTSHGSRGHGLPASADSDVVRRLRAAGAIPIGQTNVPELEIWPFTSTRAWGVTRNPWDVSRTPGGSSGGSAAAVAAGLAGAATGSDGGGSIRIPAACCALVGIKPQRGRVPSAPVRDPWHGLSVIGPLARRVGDTALMLDVMAGESSGKFSRAAGTTAGRLRIAVSTRRPPSIVTKVHPDVVGAVDETAELLRSLGHDVHRHEVPYGTAMLEFLPRYLRGIHDEAATMARPELLEPRTRGIVRMGALVPPRVVKALRAREPRLTARIGRIFASHDVVLTPIISRPVIDADPWAGRGAAITLEGVSRFIPWPETWNATGQPALAIPSAVDGAGLPIGVQLVGRSGDEATLISLAAQVEAELGWQERTPPVS
jgi:amidase